MVCLWSLPAAGADFKPVPAQDGAFETLHDDGNTAWRTVKDANGDYALYLYFQSVHYTNPGDTYYLEIDYKDAGTGALGVEYNATGSQDYQTASQGTGRLLRDTGEARVAIFELDKVDFRHAQNAGADLRVSGPGKSIPLSISAVKLFADPPPEFVASTAKPWLDPYSGPARTDVDASSLRGKVVCGYQGWFRAPGDPSDDGWTHWSSDQGRIAPDTLTFDLWPDMTEYQKKYPADGFKFQDGTQAYLFSSADPETINLHFDWMRDYGIDGVMVQQFVSDLGHPNPERTLGWVRQAANRTGRVFALEYDMSGLDPDTALQAMTAYWHHLVDDLKITDDPRYLHQDGKPVLAIFGFYKERFTGAAAAQIIDAFKQPGKYQAFVVGSGEWSWRKDTDPGWAAAFRHFDGYIPWNAGNIHKEGDVVHARTDYWADDLAEAKRNNMLYIPEIYPGFSWNNLKHTTANPGGIPRRGGDFFREQFKVAKQLGIDTAFVGMFDEADEGTAIFKIADHPPSPGYFATLEGQPSDLYMRLTGEGTQLLRDNTAEAATSAGNATTDAQMEAYRLHPEAAQADAIRLYPDLGTMGTPLNTEFTNRYRNYRISNPRYFALPDWPIRLAKECADSLAGK